MVDDLLNFDSLLAGAYFYRCDAFSSFIKWKVGSESFIIVNATGEAPALDSLGNAEFNGPPCSLAYIYASASGRATLHATLSKEFHKFDSSFHGPIVLKASSLIAAYSPLSIRQASDGNRFGGYYFDLALAESDKQLTNLDKIYLVPGTHLDVMLLGGPEQWNHGVDFIETIEILDEEHGHIGNGASSENLSESYKSLYRVSCQMMGTYVSDLCLYFIDSF